MAESKKGPAGIEPEKNPQLEAAIANKLVGRSESMNDELIATASTPQELFRGLRNIEEKLENGNIPGNLNESYRPPAQLSLMYNRATNLKVTNTELESRGWLTGYNPSTGEGLPAHRKYSAMALNMDEEFIIKDGQYVADIFGNPAMKIVFNYGTEKERAELARSYDRAVVELEARAILGEWIGTMLNLNIRDGLEPLVNWEHGTTAKFKGDHLHALFNMPDIEELATNPENRKLGDQVEEALFLNLVMLHSGNKQRMQDFLLRPGADHLISKLAKEEEHRRGSVYTRDQWVKENIGDYNNWVPDYDPSIDLVKDKDAYKKTRDLEKTWKVEASDGRRGRLTKWGNIAAFGGNPGDIAGHEEKEFIEKTVGGLVGSIEASWVAATLMRSIGTYASEGYVALPNGKSILPLGEARYISSDDRGKFYSYMFNYKEGTKGRSSGLKDMIGKIPDMAFDLFDWAQVQMVDLLPQRLDSTIVKQGEALDGTETPQKRSIWDAWLGTVGGKQKIDLLTGEKTNQRTNKEEYHRLGDLNFSSLDRDFHGSFGVMQWLLGNGEGPVGVFIDAMKVDFKYEDFLLNDLKKKNKYIGIVMNPVILTKGSMHLYENIESYKTIQKKF